MYVQVLCFQCMFRGEYVMGIRAILWREGGLDEEVDEMTKLVKFSAVANNMKPPANNTEMFLLPSFLSIAIIVVAQ